MAKNPYEDWQTFPLAEQGILGDEALVNEALTSPAANKSSTSTTAPDSSGPPKPNQADLLAEARARLKLPKL